MFLRLSRQPSTAPGGFECAWFSCGLSFRSASLGSFIPQIAGSYRGSYFSKVGLLITEIAAAPSLPSSFVSLHLSPCMLITEIAAAPSLPSSFVSLHLSPCMLIAEIAAAPSLPSSFVSLRLSPCMLISKISLLHLSSFICLPAC